MARMPKTAALEVAVAPPKILTADERTLLKGLDLWSSELANIISKTPGRASTLALKHLEIAKEHAVYAITRRR
jgi:hypothetical protein